MKPEFVEGSLVHITRTYKGEEEEQNCNIYQIVNENGVAFSVEEETIGQLVGKGEYGEIYEGMKLYDEYAEEYCTIEYDEEDCGFRICYESVTERIESLDGLRILGDDE